MTRIGLLQCVWVGAGGLVGSILRYVLHTLVQRSVPEGFPWGTLAVNVLGCLAIGVLAGWPGARDVTGEGLKLFLVVGLFGGFTTFSTFGIDTFDLLRAGSHGAALANIAVQVAASLAAVIAGFNLGRMI